MIEITKDSDSGWKPGEKKTRFFAIKNDKGLYLRGWRFTPYLNNAEIYKTEYSCINIAKRLLEQQKEDKDKSFEKLFVVEIEFKEIEE